MSDAAEVLKLDTTKVRGGNGLDAIRDEVDEVLKSAFDTTKSATEAFFESYDENPNPKALAAWLANRCWREIDYVMLLNEQIRRYGLAYKRHHITLLAKQSFQEAEHYETVGKLVETLGGEVPTSVPAMAAPWSKFLWDSMDRHPLGAIAAWYASETSATGAFEPLFAGVERHGLKDVTKTYRQIEIDEKFHTSLGRQILSTYAKTDEDRAEILRAMRGMRDIAWTSLTPEAVAKALNS